MIDQSGIKLLAIVSMLTLFASAAQAGPIIVATLEGTIDTVDSADTGSAFGLSVGDTITLVARFDADEASAAGTTNPDNCFDDFSCPINFGAGEGESFSLILGTLVLNPDDSDSGDFPGILFEDGRLRDVEGLRFVFAENGKANFDITDETGDPTGNGLCSQQGSGVFGCTFAGDDGNGNSFTGTFANAFTFEEEPGGGGNPVPEPGSLALLGLGALGLLCRRRRCRL